MTQPKIMGIVNITPDSFSDGGHFFDVDAALRHAESLVRDGADILDIGAESSRPGAEAVSVSDELTRLTPFLKHYKRHFDVPVSLDTYKSEVADFGLNSGVSIINDITGLQGDPTMAATIARYEASVVVMHMQNKPGTMQKSPEYDDVIQVVTSFLARSVERAKEAGIKEIIVDPGIGFGKTLAHNLLLLKRLDALKALQCPILIGTSRKSFIGEITGDVVGDRLEGTLVSNVLAYERGARFFRVHDVLSVKKALQVAHAIAGDICS